MLTSSHSHYILETAMTKRKRNVAPFSKIIFDSQKINDENE